jgi:DNA invertase Pin-like site-specific DNA recombinase
MVDTSQVHHHAFCITDHLDIPMKIGYARTSSSQDEDLQRHALAVASADKIFVDRGVSANTVLKPAWAEMLRSARPGDEILVCGLDRLASNLSTLLLELSLLERLGLSFRSISDDLASDPGGELFSHVRAFADFNRKAAQARAASDHAATSPEGPTGLRRKGGHVPQISEAQWQDYKEMMAPPRKLGVPQIAALAGVSRAAIYKRLKKDR